MRYERERPGREGRREEERERETVIIAHTINTH